jgi:phosphohistidine phosphatase
MKEFESEGMHKKALRIIIMRHAKSEPAAHMNDFDRRLDKRGEEEALIISERLEQLKLAIDIALVSPAQRTRETFSIVEKHIKTPTIIFDDRLYNARLSDLLSVIKEHCLEARTILLLSHNPSVSELAEHLSGTAYIFHTADALILASHFEDLSQAIKIREGFFLEQMLHVESE